jgi:uncharacterized protein (DUF305 family)
LRRDPEPFIFSETLFFRAGKEAIAALFAVAPRVADSLNAGRPFSPSTKKPFVDCQFRVVAAIFLRCIMVGGALSYLVSLTLRSVVLWAAIASSQQTTPASQSAPAIVQPGAPGTANKTLSADAAKAGDKPNIPSKPDVDFMQGIMHHSQAVEMTELLKTRTTDPAMLEIGKKIDVSQSDEMRWMKQWLTDRGFPVSADPMAGPMAGMDMKGDMKGMDMAMPMMPGMLTAAQMETLRKASGPQFDHLFLTGMIQHHSGALQMVKDLFANAGAGQDPQLFDFASDVDNTQQAEIDIMRHMLEHMSKERQ